MRLLVLLLALTATRIALAQQLTLRHDLAGPALDALATLVVKFNDAQKGKAGIRLQSLPPEAERGELPDLALLDIADAKAFFGKAPRYKPLHLVMREGREKFDPRALLPQVADAVDDADGRVQALPLGLSLPVLYLNKAMLRKAGVDPELPPRTWADLQVVAGKLNDAKVACPLTSSHFTWVHVENLASQHDQPIVNRTRKGEQVVANSMVNVKHLAMLASWQKSRYFDYSGGGNGGDRRFLSGECAMLTSDSSLYAEALRRGIETGIHALPHYDDVYGVKPDDVLPDGISLWVLDGVKGKELQVSARFIRFLMLAENQREWVRATTFLPMTADAIIALREAQVYPAPMLDAALKRLGASSRGSTRPHPVLAREKLRAIFGEEVLPVWTDNRPAKQALDLTVERANAPEPAPPRPAPKSVAEGKPSATKPVTKPVTKPDPKSATKPVPKAVTKPAAKEVAKPTVNPAPKPVAATPPAPMPPKGG